MKPEKHGKAALIGATVIASYGRHSLARSEDQTLWQVFGKGKRREVAVGDRILIQPSGDNQAWVEQIEARRNLLYRSDAMRSKLFASNLDQTILVLASSPPYSTELLGRTLIACQTAGVPLHIVFNKTDLLQGENERKDIEKRLHQWTHGEVPIHFLSVRTQAEQAKALLQSLLKNKCSLILGQSGMGKSTLLNLMIPHAVAATNEVSIALNAGKHTTTHTQMFEGENGIRLIDSPGFQAFGLNHLSPDELKDAFTDIAHQAMRCRFANCQHKQEPQCAVKIAIEEGELFAPRLQLMQLLLDEIQTTHY